MNTREKLSHWTMDVQREKTEAELERRDLLKMGLHNAGTGMLLPISGSSLRAAQDIGQKGCNYGIDKCLRRRQSRRARFRRFHL
jgi:hypothetical protein